MISAYLFAGHTVYVICAIHTQQYFRRAFQFNDLISLRRTNIFSTGNRTLRFRKQRATSDVTFYCTCNSADHVRMVNECRSYDDWSICHVIMNKLIIVKIGSIKNLMLVKYSFMLFNWFCIVNKRLFKKRNISNKMHLI